MKTRIASILLLFLSIAPAFAANDLDGDGVSDAVELADGTDPNNAADWKAFSKGMLLCYRFEGNGNDISGNGGNATLSGGPGFVSGVRGQAIFFDGVNDHFARTPVPITSNPFTYSIWVKIPVSRPYNSWITVFQQGQSQQYSPHFSAMLPEAGRYQFGGYTWTGGYSGISSPSMVCAKPNDWHHLVWASTPEGNRKLYFDGAVVATTTGQAFGEQNYYLRLGGNIAANIYDSYAADEFRVYNRALTDGEVADLYASQAPIPSNNANLSSLLASAGTIMPSFSANITSYDSVVPFTTASLTVTPAVEDSKATARVRINGGDFVPVASGTASAPLPLNPGSNTIVVQVTAEDGTVKSYQVSVQRRFPQMVVRENEMDLSDGGAVPLDFGRATRETTSSRTLTVTNTGTDDLLLGSIAVEGTHASSFTAGIPAATLLAPGASTGFSVVLRPLDEGSVSADLRISSNCPGSMNPYDIHLAGTGMGYGTDTDADGMNDAAEFNLASLGFDWNTSQPTLVASLNAGANSAGFYKSSQVHALHLGAPLISRDSVSGDFILKLRVGKSTDLIHFAPFPVTPAQIAISADGQMELRFNPGDESAFFRIEAE